jgi:transcriptional regulator with XRE-family HTH domain
MKPWAGKTQMGRAKRKSSPKGPGPKDIEIGRLIRAQRLLCGFSQTELANAIGVTFQQLQKYEKGINRVASGRLSRIADKLKVPVTFFYEGAAGPKKVADNINEGLQFLRTAGTLRLLRAFEKMDRRTQEHFLALIEIMTSGRKASRLPTVH